MSDKQDQVLLKMDGVSWDFASFIGSLDMRIKRLEDVLEKLKGEQYESLKGTNQET